MVFVIMFSLFIAVSSLLRVHSFYKIITNVNVHNQFSVVSSPHRSSHFGNTHRSTVDEIGFVEHNALGMKKQVKWNARLQRFEEYESLQSPPEQEPKFYQIMRNSFLPSGILSPDYYRYTAWRMTQRFVSATNSVFGTQALLLALGFRRNSIGKPFLVSVDHTLACRSQSITSI